MRIPRFPIGAVWRARQLALPLTFAPTPPSVEDGASPSPATPDAEPEAAWDRQPVALKVGAHLPLVSAAAGLLRVRPGMTVAAARAACATLQVLPWDEPAVRHDVARATAALLSAAPQVTPVRGAPGLWWVGAHGFDGLGGEGALAAHLLAIARTWHGGARVAIADSCVAARAATWDARPPREAADGRGAVVVPSGHDAEYLAAVPVALLPMPQPMREALAALGLGTGGALAALDPADVEQRWGAEGLAAWRRARGDDARRPHQPRADAGRAVHAELGGAVETTEPLVFLVRAALERLVAQGLADGRAIAALAVTLALDAPAGVGRAVTREVRPAAPVARVAPLLEQCRALLAAWPLPAPVTAVTVAIAATAPLDGRQGDLLDASWRDLAAVEAALARLRAELGSGSVVLPAAVDAYLPEQAGAWVEADPAAPAPTLEPPPAAALPHPDARPLRLLDPPEAAEVETDGSRPAVLRWRARRIPVTAVRGPERLDGQWWQAPVARDYWHCADAQATEYVVYADRATRRWYVQGWVD